jgi:hypothetical protein
MALSQAFSDRYAVRWDTARALAPKVIMQFAKGAWSQGSILNINFPDVPVSEVGPIELTTQGTGWMEDVQGHLRHRSPQPRISLAQPSTLSARGCGGIGGLRHWPGTDIGHSPTVRADQSEHSYQLTSWVTG